MQIVLPGALPDPREARELTSYLAEAAPTLVRWLQLSSATEQAADPAVTGCMPYEQWLLGVHGFSPHAGQNLSAGLAPLWLNGANAAEMPVWLVELVHVAPSRDGAALLPAPDLAISEAQSVALFESAQHLFEGTGFALHRTGVERWRIDIPDGFAPLCASPALVGVTSVNDWWPQDIVARPWRRLVNEVQMLWFDDPVNQQRALAGLPPVNSLWLFGGGSASQFERRQAADETQVENALLAPSIKHDWGAWIAALTELEARVFRPLAAHTPALVLLGRERIIELKPAALGRLKQWLPGSRDAWRKWWSPQN